jgi:uncharacterized protein (DUF1330 family)
MPNVEQFQALASAPDDGPVVMVNLLKFKAEGGEGGGADAYRRYGDTAVRMIESLGGRLLWAGRGEQVLIGDPREDWDAVIAVEYPSRQAFLEMVSRPDYLEAHADRERGLERTIVIACAPVEPEALGSDLG